MLIRKKKTYTTHVTIACILSNSHIHAPNKSPPGSSPSSKSLKNLCFVLQQRLNYQMQIAEDILIYFSLCRTKIDYTCSQILKSVSAVIQGSCSLAYLSIIINTRVSKNIHPCFFYHFKNIKIVYMS